MMVKMSNAYHTPVLLHTCIDYLNIQPNGTYVDLTFGGGGHSALILKNLGEKGRLFAFDQDEDAQQNALQDPRFVLIPQNFRYLKNFLRLHGVTKVDGILGDLGVSSFQFDEASRGFSFRFDAELDMRMNRSSGITAADVINDYPEEKLTALFREYAEVDHPSRVSRAIIQARLLNPITTTSQLKEVLVPLAPRMQELKFLAKIFQALRIEVNGEMEVLKECLTQCADVLVKGGRLVIISYHSLEDRLVKNLIRTGNIEGVEVKDMIYGTSVKMFKNLTSKPIIPDEEEIQNNTRARSAKLRVAEKLI